MDTPAKEHGVVAPRPNSGTIKASRTVDLPPPNRRRYQRADRTYRTDLEQEAYAELLGTVDHSSFWEHVAAYQQERHDARCAAL